MAKKEKKCQKPGEKAEKLSMERKALSAEELQQVAGGSQMLEFGQTAVNKPSAVDAAGLTITEKMRANLKGLT